MLSTMMPEQLTISTILQFGATVHKDAVVTTWTDSGPRKVTFGDVGARSAQLANALRSLGITVTSAWRRSSGTIPSTWRPTSLFPRWARCCTR